MDKCPNTSIYFLFTSIFPANRSKNDKLWRMSKYYLMVHGLMEKKGVPGAAYKAKVIQIKIDGISEYPFSLLISGYISIAQAEFINRDLSRIRTCTCAHS